MNSKKRSFKSLILSLLLLFFLVGGCSLNSKSNKIEVNEINELISNLDVVTLEKENEIELAEEKYQSLTDDEKKEIRNYQRLIEAQEIIEDLKIEEIINRIDKIGDIKTLEDIKEIETIRDIYSSLPGSKQKKVTNLEKLKKHENYVSELNTKIDKAVSKINVIGTVYNSEASMKKIKLAREAYDEIGKISPELVPNYQKLIDAEKSLEAILLKEIEEKIDSIGEVTLEKNILIKEINALLDVKSFEADPNNIDVFIEAEKKLTSLADEQYTTLETLIENIGEASLDKEDEISAANSEYERMQLLGLNPDKNVSNISILTTSNSTLNKMKKDERLAQIKDNFYSERDEVYNITFYYHNGFPKYVNERNFFLPYIGQHSTGQKYLLTRANYTADNWVFWKKLIISIDGENLTITPKRGDIITDHRAGEVCEYADFDEEIIPINILKKIAESENTIVRFEGREHYFDYSISTDDKQLILETLDYYSYLE